MDNPLYEGMFLFDVATVGSSTKNAIDEVTKILDHNGVEAEAIYKWDDRKLAYEIGKAKRGIYVLTYFRCAGEKIAKMERDVNLSETVLRAMFLRADHMGDVELDEARAQAQTTRDAIAVEGDGEGEAKEETASASSE